MRPRQGSGKVRIMAPAERTWGAEGEGSQSSVRTWLRRGYSRWVMKRHSGSGALESGAALGVMSCARENWRS